MTNLPSPAALVTAALSALIAAAGLLALQILLGLEYSRPVVSDHREQPEIILRAADDMFLPRGDLIGVRGLDQSEGVDIPTKEKAGSCANSPGPCLNPNR